MSRAASSVTVIGLGPMGQAMVQRLRASGLVVTVWNRSQEKAIAMERFGAARAHTAAQALDAGEVIGPRRPAASATRRNPPGLCTTARTRGSATGPGTTWQRCARATRG